MSNRIKRVLRAFELQKVPAAVVIVVGMHRSGTSVLSELLHTNGIAMGCENTFFPKPSPENPHGFFEDVRFREINDRILRSRGYSVKSWVVAPHPLHADWKCRLRMRELIQDTNRQAAQRSDPRFAWGWKDPRTCLTLAEWFRTIPSRFRSVLRVVLITREPISVARSMVKRRNTDLFGAIQVWLDYHERIQTAVDTCDWLHQPLYMTYEALCRHPNRQADRMARYLNWPIEVDQAQRSVDPSLQRNMASSLSSDEERQIEGPTKSHALRTAQSVYSSLSRRANAQENDEHCV